MLAGAVRAGLAQVSVGAHQGPHSRKAEAPKTLVEWLLGLAARTSRTRLGVPH